MRVEKNDADEIAQLKKQVKKLENEIVQRTRNFMYQHHQGKSKIIRNQTAVQTEESLEALMRSMTIDDVYTPEKAKTCQRESNSEASGKNTRQLDDECTKQKEQDSQEDISERKINNYNSEKEVQVQVLKADTNEKLQFFEEKLKNSESKLSSLLAMHQVIKNALNESEQKNYQLNLMNQHYQTSIRQLTAQLQPQNELIYQIQQLLLKVEKMEIMKKEYLRAYSKMKEQKEKFQRMNSQLIEKVSFYEKNNVDYMIKTIPEIYEDEHDRSSIREEDCLEQLENLFKKHLREELNFTSDQLLLGINIVQSIKHREYHEKDIKRETIKHTSQSNDNIGKLDRQEEFLAEISCRVFDCLCNLPTGDHGVILFPPQTKEEFKDAIESLYLFSLHYDKISQEKQEVIKSDHKTFHQILKIMVDQFSIPTQILTEILKVKCQETDWLCPMLSNLPRYTKKINRIFSFGSRNSQYVQTDCINE